MSMTDVSHHMNSGENIMGNRRIIGFSGAIFGLTGVWGFLMFMFGIIYRHLNCFCCTCYFADDSLFGRARAVPVHFFLFDV